MQRANSVLLGTAVMRPAVEDDLPALLAIYDHAVENTLATMDTEPRTAEQMRQWLHAHGGVRYVARVAEVDGAVVAGRSRRTS